MKRTISLLLALSILFCSTASASAISEISIDAAGVTNYSLCTHGDRAGFQYIDMLEAGIQESYLNLYVYFSNYYTSGSTMFFSGCTKADVLMETNNAATLFAYAGHGVVYDSLNNAFHLNDNSQNKQHSQLTNGENNLSINVRTTDLANSKHQYFVAYCCNFLTAGSSTAKLNNMYKIGSRVICGFCSTMYLDSREGLYFGRLMKNQSVRSAFLNAASKYQPSLGKGNTIIARGIGYTPAKYEHLDAGQSLPPSYANSPNSYSCLQTVYIEGKDNYNPE